MTDAKDAKDAKDVKDAKAPEAAAAPKPLVNTEDIMEWLRPVQDPELFLSVVDLGLVYEARIDENGFLDVYMTLTSPGCPAGDYIVDEMTRRAKEHPQVKEAHVQIVWEPKWDPVTMASDEVKDRLGIW